MVHGCLFSTQAHKVVLYSLRPDTRYEFKVQTMLGDETTEFSDSVFNTTFAAREFGSVEPGSS